jgi:capsule polysaccharide export protein KpsE/RkpR
LLKIEKHNREADQGIHSYRTSVNQFTDLDSDELKSFLTAKVPTNLPKNKARLLGVNANLLAMPSAFGK